MAYNYSLTCFDCRVELWLGKVYCIDKDGRELEDWTFDGVWDCNNDTWRKRDGFFGQVIEKFLINHRNHELRFIIEGVDDLLEEKIGFIEEISANTLISKPIDPEPDPELELAKWKEYKEL